MDLFQRLQPVRQVLEAHLETLVVVHLLALVLLFLLSGRVLLEPFRRTSRRHLATLLLIVVASWGVRAWVIPALTGHVFDGHEADYFDVWRHAERQPDFAYRASSVLRLLYGWAGPCFGGSGSWLIGLHLLASLSIPPLVWSWLADLTGDEEAGLWTGALLAADPVLGFWSSSAYNVLLPFVLSVAALAALERGRVRANVSALAFAGTVWAAAVALRPEAVLLVVPVGWRLAGARRILASLPWKVPALGFPALILTAYLVLGQQTAVGGEGLQSLLSMFRRQVFMFDLFTPYNRLSCAAVLAVLVAAIGIGAPRRRWLIGLLLITAASQHLAYALFDDYGYRHTLLIRLSLASLAGVGIVSVHLLVDEAVSGARVAHGWRLLAAPLLSWTLYAVLVLPSLHDVLDVARRYYASSETFYRADPRFQSFPDLDVGAYAGCVWVAESDCLDVGVRASHFELFDDTRRGELESLSRGCVLFAYDRENFQASSRSIHDRAVKVMRLFSLEPLGKVVQPGRDCYALVFRVVGARRQREAGQQQELTR